MRIYISQLSNVDGVADVGTHSDFSKQQSAPDNVYDTLTEAAVVSGSATFGDNPGSGTSYVTMSGNGMYLGVYVCTQTGRLKSITFYGRGASASGLVKGVVCNSSGVILAVSSPITFNTATATRTISFTDGPILYANTTYWIGIITDAGGRLYYNSTTGGNSRIDTSNNFDSPTDPTDATEGTYIWRQMYATVEILNYQLQLEEQFTSIPSPQKVSIAKLHIVTGSFSGEGLNIEVWNGSSWVSIGSLSASTDNEFNVLQYLTSVNLYIRFHDADPNDLVQDTWQIDSVWLDITIALYNCNASSDLGSPYYKLDWQNTTVSTYRGYNFSPYDDTWYFGSSFCIYRAGSIIPISSGAVVTIFSNGETLSYATWTPPPNVLLYPGDRLEQIVYVFGYVPSGSQPRPIATFVTSGLEGVLDTVPATVYYYIYKSGSDSRFYFGDSLHPSRIEGLQIKTKVPLPTDILLKQLNLTKLSPIDSGFSRENIQVGYVSSFDNSISTGWTCFGRSPYIDAVDQYWIRADVVNSTIGNFYFSIPASLCKIYRVVLNAYIASPYPEQCYFDFFKDGSYVRVATFDVLSTNWNWYSVTLSPSWNDWNTLNTFFRIVASGATINEVHLDIYYSASNMEYQNVIDSLFSKQYVWGFLRQGYYDSKILTPSDTFSVRFTCPYHCTINNIGWDAVYPFYSRSITFGIAIDSGGTPSPQWLNTINFYGTRAELWNYTFSPVTLESGSIYHVVMYNPNPSETIPLPTVTYYTPRTRRTSKYWEVDEAYALLKYSGNIWSTVPGDPCLYLAWKDSSSTLHGFPFSMYDPSPWHLNYLNTLTFRFTLPFPFYADAFLLELGRTLSVSTAHIYLILQYSGDSIKTSIPFDNAVYFPSLEAEFFVLPSFTAFPLNCFYLPPSETITVKMYHDANSGDPSNVWELQYFYLVRMITPYNFQDSINIPFGLLWSTRSLFRTDVILKGTVRKTQSTSLILRELIRKIEESDVAFAIKNLRKEMTEDLALQALIFLVNEVGSYLLEKGISQKEYLDVMFRITQYLFPDISVYLLQVLKKGMEEDAYLMEKITEVVSANALLQERLPVKALVESLMMQSVSKMSELDSNFIVKLFLSTVTDILFSGKIQVPLSSSGLFKELKLRREAVIDELFSKIDKTITSVSIFFFSKLLEVSTSDTVLKELSRKILEANVNFFVENIAKIFSSDSLLISRFFEKIFTDSILRECLAQAIIGDAYLKEKVEKLMGVSGLLLSSLRASIESSVTFSSKMISLLKEDTNFMSRLLEKMITSSLFKEKVFETLLSDLLLSKKREVEETVLLYFAEILTKTSSVEGFFSKISKRLLPTEVALEKKILEYIQVDSQFGVYLFSRLLADIEFVEKLKNLLTFDVYLKEKVSKLSKLDIILGKIPSTSLLSDSLLRQIIAKELVQDTVLMSRILEKVIVDSYLKERLVTSFLAELYLKEREKIAEFLSLLTSEVLSLTSTSEVLFAVRNKAREHLIAICLSILARTVQVTDINFGGFFKDFSFDSLFLKQLSKFFTLETILGEVAKEFLRSHQIRKMPRVILTTKKSEELIKKKVKKVLKKKRVIT